jgi:foldase protein PrsA
MSDDEIDGRQPEEVDRQEPAEQEAGGAPVRPAARRRPRPGPAYVAPSRARRQSNSLNPLIVPSFAVVALLALVAAVVFSRVHNQAAPAATATATTAPLPTPAPTATLVPVKLPATTKAGVAAVVHGEVVPMSLFNTLVTVENARLQHGGTDASGNPIAPVNVTTAAGRKQLYQQEQTDLNQLIQTAAAVAYAKAHHLVATSKQIQAQLNSIYSQSGGKAAFLKNVGAEGYTPAAVTKIVTDNATEQNVYNEISKNAPYDGRIVRHILLPAKDHALALKLAKELQADHGSNFAALAKKYSTDTGSKAQGGNLGLVVKGQTVPAFEKAVFSLKVGQISNPVKSQYGWHIIEVTGLGQSPTAKSNYFTSWLQKQARGATIYAQIPKA